MRLKTLEIQGFKSFADKTQFEFHPGVTAIVGPNGCGKSNVVDSIRWVLGETSAKALRGGEMADVIFNGTDKRKPVGMAEVTLTFADCEAALKVDFNEVSLTRRVFRDGRSEYRLNNRLCRLKDIQNLLMDTGIGRTAYSIMEQGKIDQLLSSKPEDRRAVFEEAAGITKFKMQKKEALRKLEYTESNLLRVTDIIAELSRQRDSLQRQANKAKRYREMLDDLTTLDTHWTHRQFRDLQAERDELATSIGGLQRQEEESRELVERSSLELSGKRESLEAAEAEHHELALEQVSLRNKIQSSQDRIESNHERAEEFKRFIGQNEAQIAETKAKLEQQKIALETAEQSLLSLQSQLDAQRSELGSGEEQHRLARTRRAEMQGKLQQLQSQRQRLMAAVASLEASHASKLEQREVDARRAASFSDEIGQLETEQAQFQRDGEQLIAAIQEEVQALEACQAERQRLEAEAQRLMREQQDMRAKVRDAERVVSSTKSRRDLIVQWVEQGEGFEKGTQRVLQGLDEPATFKGSVRGVLGSMLTVKDDQHLAAVEAALREHLQTVLVANGTAAEAIIERLGDKQLGFASVASEDGAHGQPVVITAPADCPPVLSVVEVDEKIQALVERLLGNVYLATSLARAREAQAAHPGSAYVTAKGEFLSPMGIIHGGATKQAKESVLQKQSEIRKLQREIKKLEEQHSEVAKQLAEVDAEAARMQAQRDEQNERSQQHKLNRSRLEDQRRLAQMESQRVTSRLAKARAESEELTRRQQSALAEMERIAQDRQARQAELDSLEESGAASEEELRQLTEREAEAANALNALRTRMALEEQAEAALRQQRQPMTGRLQELETLWKRHEEEIVTFSRRQEELEAENGQLREQAKQSREAVEDVARRQGESMERRKTVQTQVRELENLLARLNQERGSLQEQRGREEVRTTQLELRIESLTEAIRERYQMELWAFEPDAHRLLLSLESYKSRSRRGAEAPRDEITASLEDEPNWDFIGEAVREMRQKLDGMGPVNLDAIQEFEEAEERLQFLQEQHEDLTGSKVELLEVLAKINTESRKQFAETFEKVRGNFQTMFRELFGEQGKADLVLIDESDPLESGIDIIAKPPGKKLQTISLLSGGERSMTAVALLFAIYMVKPSPFCVLDELDAPLDEANIGRFVSILDRFIEQSQFVIVTHSKRTMNRADVMYGVTMEEFGVSKPVGMKLSDENKEREKKRGAIPTPVVEEAMAVEMA